MHFSPLYRLVFLGSFWLLFTIHSAFGQLNVGAARALVSRVVPQRAASFVVEPLSATPGTNTFEIESRSGKIVLRGSNGVSVASALYHYLTEYGHCQITWNGTNLTLPATLPAVPAIVRKSSPYTYRY